jgi:hypothetical protein
MSIFDDLMISGPIASILDYIDENIVEGGRYRNNDSDNYEHDNDTNYEQQARQKQHAHKEQQRISIQQDMEAFKQQTISKMQRKYNITINFEQQETPQLDDTLAKEIAKLREDSIELSHKAKALEAQKNALLKQFL